MTERKIDFKRMLLGLPHSAGDYASVAFTAELAEQLGLDLVGIFVEDGNLEQVAALPCTREFRTLSGGWHPIDAGQWEKDFKRAAEEAQRLFNNAAKSLRVGRQFNLTKGPIVDIFGTQSNVDDLIVIIEPKNPAERVTQQFRQLIDVACQAPASVLMVPSHIQRRVGPIIAIAAGPQDPSILAALNLAASTKESLIVLAPRGSDLHEIAQRSKESGVPFDWRLILGKSAGATELMAMLSETKERFLVLGRESSGHLPLMQLSSMRGVPLLVMESFLSRAITNPGA